MTSFVIHNPTSQEIEVTIEVFRSDGSALAAPQQRHLGPDATMTVQTASADSAVSAGWARLSSTGRFAATEFFELTVGSQKLPIVGVLPSASATKARLFTFLSAGTNTGLAIANPSSGSTTVTVRLIPLDGTSAGTQTLTLGAHEHRAQFINEGLFFPTLTQFEGTVEVEATTPVIMLGLRGDAGTAGFSTISAMTPPSATLVDGSVQTQHLADAAVTTAKLTDGSITTAKIAGNAVTTEKIADSSVGSAKIIDASIGAQDLADGSVTKTKLAASGGTSGQVLGTDGTSLTWQTIGGAGGATITLPYSGSGSTAASTDLFYLNNTGSGRAIQGRSVSDSAIFGLSTSGAGIVGQSNANDGVVGRAEASGRSGVWGTGTSSVGVTGSSSGNDGVFGVSTSPDSGDAGVHGRNTSSGPAVLAEGNLHVTGAFIGNVGQNHGAPFPRPAYDSGWLQVDGWKPIELDPGLPVGQYDSRDFVVDLQRQYNALATNRGIGGDEENATLTRGMAYEILPDNRIRIVNGSLDDYLKTVRVRIWVYQ